MIGTIVNTGTILVGSVIGSIFQKGIQEKQQQALYTAMGLAATGLVSTQLCKICLKAIIQCFLL